MSIIGVLHKSYSVKSGVRYPYVCSAIIIINIAVYIFQEVLNDYPPTFSVYSLYKMGGNVGALTLSGDIWRMFTSLFLHGNLKHLAMNMFALLVFGSLAEKRWGHFTFFVVYFVCGLAASFCSAIWNYYNEAVTVFDQHVFTVIVSVGASGAIAGILGACIELAFSEEEDGESALTFSEYFLLVFFFFSYGFFTSNVDNVAHIGGFIIGIALCLPLMLYRIEWCEKRTMYIFYLIFVASFGFLFSWMLRDEYAKHAPDELREKVQNIYTKMEYDRQRAIYLKDMEKIDADAARNEWKKHAATLEKLDTNTVQLIDESQSAGVLLPGFNGRKAIAALDGSFFLLAGSHQADNKYYETVYRYSLQKPNFLDKVIDAARAEFDVNELITKQYISRLDDDKRAAFTRFSEEKKEETIRQYAKYSIEVPLIELFGRGIADMAVSEDGQYGYFASLEKSSVSVVDLSDKRIINTAKIGNAPKSLVVHENRIYVLDPSMFTLFILDRESLSIIDTLSWADEGSDYADYMSWMKKTKMVIDGDGNHLYFIDYRSLYSVSLSKKTITRIDRLSHSRTLSFSDGALDIRTDKQGRVWALFEDGIYLPDMEEDLYFECHPQSFSREMSNNAVLVVMKDGSMLIAEPRLDKQRIYGYSARTGLLLRVWGMGHYSRDEFSLMDMHDGEHMFSWADREARLLKLNQSTIISPELRETDSLSRYRCLTQE